MLDCDFIPTFGDVCKAAGRLRDIVRRTPVVPLHEFSAKPIGIWLKCENLQVSGAFKYRGAMNALLCLDPSVRRRGVATHSSGNHGGALASAARKLGVEAHIVVPASITPFKRAAIVEQGGFIYECGPSVEDREAMLAHVVAKTGASVVHPYDDPNVIAGQGTAALELLEEIPDLDVIVAPISGGGLMSGTAIVAHGVEPGIRLIGAEPELAGDAAISLSTGKRSPPLPTAGDTMADGLRAGLCERTFTILSRHVGHVITVSEEQILAAMKSIWDQTRLAIEPSSAVAIAAVQREPERFAGKRVGIIVTGGNIDERPAMK